jgi:alpha-tubulin suppressor-like RCC1 family protein
MRAARALVLALMLVMAQGCTEVPTRIVARIESDLAPCAELKTVDVIARWEGGGVLGMTHLDVCGQALRYPGEVAISPKDPADARRVVLTVSGTVQPTTGAAYTLRQEFVLGFQRGRALVVRYALSRVCAVDLCPSGYSCVPGAVGEARCASREAPVVVGLEGREGLDAAVWGDSVATDAVKRDIGGGEAAGDGSLPDVPAPADATDAVKSDIGGGEAAGDGSPPDVPAPADAADAGDGDCPAGMVRCAGTCIDLRIDAQHCGGCGMACSRANVTATCAGGICTGTCADGFGDCNGDRRTDGCETDMRTDPMNCGRCGTRCASTERCLLSGCLADTRAIEVRAGNTHTCACLANGRVRCWGQNNYGQLGDGTLSVRTSPVAVSGISGAVHVGAGGGYSCALVTGGAVWCWGANTVGQLGVDPSSTPGNYRLDPAPVPGLSGVESISVGFTHTCARHISGSISCWGENTYGQLGDGTTMPYRSTPRGVASPGVVDEVSAGHWFTCARMAGASTCWGRNNWGQFGNGTNTTTLLPSTTLRVTDAIQVRTWGDFTCALLMGGAVRCWGLNSLGQIDTTSTTYFPTPVAIPTLSDVRELAVGGRSSCARQGDGAVLCWGASTNGLLGDGSTRTLPSAPVRVTGLSAPVGISVGGTQACANTTDGAVWCWGDNMFGQIGDGTMIQRFAPVRVMGLP